MLKQLENISTIIILRTFLFLLYKLLEAVQSMTIGFLPSPSFRALSLEETDCLKEMIRLLVIFSIYRE